MEGFINTGTLGRLFLEYTENGTIHIKMLTLFGTVRTYSVISSLNLKLNGILIL